MDFAFPYFRPRAPWLGGDLQTLRNYLRRLRIDLSPWPAERRTFATGDGSDDYLEGWLHLPAVASGRPLAVLIHGLTGCADSTYIRASARYLLEHGFAVLRLNLRGAGPSRAWCAERYHAGRTADLGAVLAALPPNTTQAGVVAAGFSLGGNLLLKHIGENAGAGGFRAVASVSAPVDLRAASVRLMALRNRPYQNYLLRRMRSEAFGPKTRIDGVIKVAALRARTVYDFDDRVVAPRNGFASAEDYYVRCSARQHLGEITVPTLLIHADDDPWIPSEAYRAFAWQTNPNLTALLPSSGGHVGFHGAGADVAWHNLCIARFFDRVCAGG